jgi:glycine/D-amino acid oxidase-like deaminating enzyme
MQQDQYDALVVGGGFYGATIACYLAERRGLRRVALVEREMELLSRASYRNQARVHNGYHYPRSITTAYRSRINLPRFVRDHPDAIRQDFTKLYAIARNNSKVTARQFERFCRDIGAPFSPAKKRVRELFSDNLIEEVFSVEEYAFDAAALRRCAERDLQRAGVDVRMGCTVLHLRNADRRVVASYRDQTGDVEELSARHVFNCAYSGLDLMRDPRSLAQARLKHEITEMALIQVPDELHDLGITVMDGPFFSCMPFPPRGLHTLSHVRYTPHVHWQNDGDIDPYRKLDEYGRISRVDRMVRDAARFVPAIRNCSYVESIFEVKTVLAKNEGDDGRPILFERHQNIPNCYAILGGKIDNIYDVVEKLDAEKFDA